MQIDIAAEDVKVKIFPGEQAKTLEAKMNDWFREMGALGNVRIRSVSLNDSSSSFYSAVVTYTIDK